ncbi:hypothetical protein C8A03DRAFT_12527 [Achaetomium macrosporum]|uniref:Uncharacterized protein n=1 Tax=Achaetomium macrosporum TaxID=79813 RepID=A0AAN7CG76_9PEZI|nr:hypothetical protein C8A03DRAFT_12527 [Achaetomium macrosporum]
MAFVYALVLIVSVLVAAYARRRRELCLRDKAQLRPGTSSRGEREKTDENTKSELTSTIEPLRDFDWQVTRPLKLRPFKPTYNITMAIQATTPSELILMDSNYLSRVTARRQIVWKHTSAVHGAIPSGHAPIRELYSYLLGSYLPTRYPTMFELIPDVNSQKTTTFRNKVTRVDSPLHPAPSDPLEMLRILGETVEDDMFLLLRDPDSASNGNGNGGGEHRAVAFVCCHPSGFAPAGKLGKRLAEIHVPVPAYEKIGASMERYFARLEAGRGVKRMNWSIQTHPNLYAPSGNHVHVGEEVEEEKAVDVENSRFRVELQTLTRLPETQAILFSFKTYLYPLEDIKAEGLGPQLADAIEGLKAGNAPGMWVYKGGVRWGRAICEYLRE